MPSGLTVTLRMKDYFFDRVAVVERIGRANAKSLSRAGAFIRRRARSSLKRRQLSSLPGRPPSVHSGSSHATLKNILFAYEPHRESLVVGPVRINSQVEGAVMGPTTVPQLLEFGGDVRLTSAGRARLAWVRRQAFNRGRDAKGRFKKGKRLALSRAEAARIQAHKTGVARYRARPFMGPALDAEKTHIPDAWRGTL